MGPVEASCPCSSPALPPSPQCPSTAQGHVCRLLPSGFSAPFLASVEPPLKIHLQLTRGEITNASEMLKPEFLLLLVRRHSLSLETGHNFLLEGPDTSPSEQTRSPGHHKLPVSGATRTLLLAFTLVLPYCLHSVPISCLFLKNKHLSVLDCFLHTLVQMKILFL